MEEAAGNVCVLLYSCSFSWSKSYPRQRQLSTKDGKVIGEERKWVWEGMNLGEYSWEGKKGDVPTTSRGINAIGSVNHLTTRLGGGGQCRVSQN